MPEPDVERPTDEPPERDHDRERSLAAASYVLTWLTGLIVYIVADEEERFARWHAIQAIGLGVVFYVVSAVLSAMAAFLALLVGFDVVELPLHAPGPFWLGVGGGVLGGLLPLALLVAIVVLAVKAYRGQRPRLPVIARFADDLA